MPTDLGQQMQQLYQQFGDIAGVTIELHQDLLALRVDNDQASATVFLQGAQLSHYQKQGEQAIIWCSPECDYTAGVPLRGGIPVCWPWFGELAKNPDAVQQQINHNEAPVHGFARQRQWQLSAVEAIHSGLTRLQLQLSLAEGDEALWPWATELQLTILVGESLELSLEVHNSSEQSLCFSSALHSYFSVADIDQVTITGLEGLSYIDFMDDWRQYKQQGALIIDREVDRIYSGTANSIQLVDQQWQRSIRVSNEGSNSAVLWNPWQEKSRRLPHFADDAYKRMLCIETANADQDFVQLAAGDTHRLALTISSSTLD